MRHTRAIALIVLALVVALAAVLVALRWINAQAAPSSSKVAVASADINLGARLAPEMITLVDWPAGALPPGAIGDPRLLETRVARSNIGRGEPVLESKLAPVGTVGGLSAALGDGKRAMTVRVNDVVGVAGFALPGNFVDVLVNTQDEAEKKRTQANDAAISKIVLERILVLAIAQESSRDDTKPKVVNAVTLELTPEQAEKLDLARSVGTLSLVLRNQIEDTPVNTDGATRSTLLDLKPPARVPVATVRRTAAPVPPARAAGEHIEVIKGLERSAQQLR